MVGSMVWILLALSAVVVCVAVIFAVRKSMNELLKVNSYISPARRFYLRTFSLIIFLAALGVIFVAGRPCDQQSESFMQCVWWVCDQLGGVLWAGILSVGGYVLLLTILFAVLGRYRDE